MAKKKGCLGKLVAFTAVVTAVGGTCYIFRDKIKESALYTLLKDKLSKEDDFDEDFFFDDDEDEFADEDLFDDSDSNREYSSITINAKKPEEASEPEEATEAEEVEEAVDTAEEEDKETVDAEDSIPTIDFSTPDIVSNKASEEMAKAADASGYENEGLSDVSEDADVLEDQDRLDF